MNSGLVAATIALADRGAGVARACTIQAVTDLMDKPIRPPAWLVKLFGGGET